MLNDKISFSLSLNSQNGPVKEAVKLAVLAEKSGMECVWYCQDLFQRDVWVFLTAAASMTKNIGIGTGIVNPYTVNPAELAMHATTLDEYSNGRLNFGISVGALEFLKWVGIQVKKPLTRMRESIYILRQLIRGERVQFDGKVFKGWTNDAYLRFNPIRNNIPIYIGAQGPKMLELIGEIADGGLPILFPPEHITEVLHYIRKGAKKRERNIEELDIVGCIWFSLSKDTQSAKDALRSLVTYYGPHLSPRILEKVGLKSEDFDVIREAHLKREYCKAKKLMTDEMAELAIYGSPDDCIERIESLIKEGLKHIRVGPPLGPDPVETIKLLGKKIIPYFYENYKA